MPLNKTKENPVQDEAVSQRANILWKGMNPTILSPAIDK